MQAMRRYAHNLLAALLCMCLLISYTPLPASAAEGSYDPSVSDELDDATMTGDGQAQANTTVNVLTVPTLEITSKTDDFVAALGSIKDNPMYDLKVAVVGAQPFTYEWTRTVNSVKDETFSFTGGPTYELSKNVETLANDTIYVYTVKVTDAVGKSVEASIGVEVSEKNPYSDRTFEGAGMSVAAYAHYLAVLSASMVDPASSLYNTLQEAAQGAKMAGAWQASLANSSGEAAPYLNDVTISLPATGVPEGAEIVVVGLNDSGEVKTYSGTLENGKVTFTAPTLGAFALAYQVPSADPHTIEASVEGAGGQISPAGTVEVADGDSKTFRFLPDGGYVVNEVKVDGTAVDAAEIVGNAYTFTEVKGKRTISVSFKQVPVDPATTHTVSASVQGGNGTATVEGAAQAHVEHGKPAVVSFAPEKGYVVDKVTVSVAGGAAVDVQPTSTNELYLSAVEADTAVTVTFKSGVVPPAPRFTVSATATGEGTISPASNTVEQGKSTQFTVDPAAGHRLASLTIDGQDALDKLDGTTLTVWNVVSDRKVVATFEPIPSAQVTVTASAGEGGAISPSGASQVAAGSSLTFYLHPDEGYRLKSLMLTEKGGASQDVTDRVSGGVFVLDDARVDCALAASFELTGIVVPDDVYYAVTASAGEGGSISPAGTVRVKAGGSQTFHFLPSEGYTLDAVTVDDQSVQVNGLSYTLSSVAANAAIKATFKPVGEGPKPDVPVTHAIQATAGPGGAVSPAGSVQVPHGGSMSFSFIPQAGFEVDQVTVDGQALSAEDTAKGSYRFDNVVADDHTVHVTFKVKETGPVEPDYYTLAVEAGENGTAAPLGATRTAAGTVQTVYAYPNEGYVVDQVMVTQGDASAVDRAADLENGTSLSLTMTADTQVSVTFRAAKADEGEETPSVKKYTLTASATEGGSISPAGAVEVAEGGSLAYTVAAESGYHLKGVTAGGKAVAVENGRFMVEDVRADMDVVATFEADAPQPVEPTYRTVQASATGGGSISPEGSVRVATGKAQTFYFYADEGHALEGVYVNSTKVEPASANSYTFASVQEDASIEARFRALDGGEEPPVQPTVHTISASASTGGTVSPAGQTKVAEGGDLLLTFTPDAGYALKDVTVDGKSALDQVSDNTLRFTGVVDSYVVRAVFERVGAPEPDVPVRYTVEASVTNGGGTISPSGTTSVAAGSSQTFYFTPDDGKKVESLTVNDTTFAWSALSYTLADISADTTIEVTFTDVPADEPKPVVPTMHTVNASVTGEGGTVSPAGDTQVADNGSLALTFTPAEGFELATVTAGDQDVLSRVSADGVLRLTGITGNLAVVASFKAKAVEPGPSGEDYRTVSVSAGEGGSISPAGDVRVARGASQSFTVVPDEGKRLASLTLTHEDGTTDNVTDQMNGGVYTLADVQEDCALHATFEAGEPDAGDVPEALFSVRAIGSTGGTVSPSGLTTAAKGSSLTFTFTPDAGFELKKVELGSQDVTDQVKNGVYVLADIQADATVKATFAAQQPVDPQPAYYKVTSSVKGGHGSISPEGQVRVKAGASQVYLLVPEAGYVLDQVSVDGAKVTVDGYTFTLADVQKDSAVEVTFRQKTTDEPDPVLPTTHTVTAQASPGGSVSPAGSFAVAEGSSPLFTFTADAGYQLASVTLNGADATDQVAGGVLRLAPVKGDVALSATFERVSAPEPPLADPVITATAGTGGSISPAGDVRVARGASQTFSIIPEANHKVASLTVNGNAFAFSGTSYTLFDVQADATVHVTFEESPDTPAPTVHTVSTSATAGGQVVPEGDVSVVDGAGLTVSFAPFDGYELYRVSVDGQDLSAEQMAQGFYRFNDVREGHALKAFFKQANTVDPVDPDDPDKPTGYAVIDASAGEGGSIDPEGPVKVLLGGSQTFEFKPSEGYELDQVLVNGQLVQVSGLTYAFDDVRAAASIRATFKKVVTPPEPKKFVIKASATEGGTIAPSGDVEVDEGKDASFSFAAKEGFELAYLEVDDGRVEASQVQNNSYTFPSVSAPHTIRAVFKALDPVEPEYAAVHASAGAGGSISPAGETQVEKGSSLAFYLHPDEGYRLKSLMLSEGAGNPVDVTERVSGGVFVLENVQGACSLTASFELTGIVVPDDVYYAVTASAGEGGSISPSGTVRVKAGGSQTFHFLPSEGYTLDQVLVNDQPVQVNGLSYTLEAVAANAAVKATFKPVGEGPKPDVPVTHAIQASAGAGGSISPSGSVQVLHGGSMSFAFIPLAGFEIDQVTVDGQPLDAQAAAKGSYRFDNVTEDGHAIRATFKAKASVPDEPDYYALTVEAGPNGTASPLGATRVVAGGDQTIYAFPNEGYVVDKVMVTQGDAASVDCAGDLANGTSLSLTMTADTQVSVTFRAAKADEGEVTPPVKKYTLVSSASAGGSISPVGAVEVAEGGSLSYTAAAEEGYRLARITVDGKPVVADDGRFVVSDVRADMQVRAEFEAQPVEPVEPTYRTVQASATGGGSISPEGSVRVAQGKAQTFYFYADEGHALEGVYVNGTKVELASANSYTFVSVQEDASIEARFRALDGGEEPPVQPTVHTISASASTGGTVSPAGQTKVAEGGDLLLTFTPDAGYALKDVTVDGKSALDQVSDNTLRFTGVVDSYVVRAVFERAGAPEPDPTVRYTVDASAVGGGAVSPSGTTELAAGASQTFYFAPDAGKQVKSLTVNDTTFAWSALSYTISDIVRDTTLVVTFEDVPADGSDPVKPQTYKVTSSVDGTGGTVSPLGETVVAEHGSLTLTFTPDQGFELASVKVGGQDALDRVSASGALRLTDVSADTAVTASFAPKAVEPGPSGDDYRTVSVSAGEGGSVSPAGDVRVARGASQSFTVVPDEGKRLASLTLTHEDGTTDNVTGQVNGGVYTLSDVQEDCALHATFEAGEPDAGDVPEALFSIQAIGSTGGTVSPSGLTTAAKGSSLTFTFTPDAGFELKKVELGSQDVTDQVKNGVYVLANIQADATVKATFAAKPAVDPQPTYYTVAASVEGGHGSISPEGDVRVKAGASQTFLFTPDENYVLDQVTVDGKPAASDGYTFTLADVQKDAQVEVSFRQKTTDEPDPVLPTTHMVTAQASPGGSVSPAGFFAVAEGSSPLLTFAPEAGYQLAQVLVNGADATYRVVGGALRLAPVTGDVTVYAAFERVSAPEPPLADPVITATAGTGGSISPAGDVRVTRGSSQTFSFIPEADYVVDRISVDGREFAFSGTSYTLFDVQVDTTLHVEFKHEPGTPVPTVHTVSASATAGGQVVPEGDVSVVEGGALSVNFAAYDGYELYRVSVDGQDLPAEQMAQGFYRFSDVREGHALKAFFKQAGSVNPDPDEDPDKPAAHAVVEASAGPGGSIDPSGSVEVLLGADQMFTFLPNEGFEVDQVLVNGQPVQVSGLSYTMPKVSAAGSIHVTFKEASGPAPATHVIMASASSGGRIDPSGRVVVDDGASRTFNIVADEGFELDYLEIDGGRVDASAAADGSYTFSNVHGDRTIHAVFKAAGSDPVVPDYAVVHASAGTGGTISPAGDTRVEKGGSLVLVMLPFDGYKLADVTVNGVSALPQVQDNCRLVLTGIDAETTVRATFAELGDDPAPDLPVVHSVQASSTSGGTISPRGTVRVVEGDDATFAVNPDEGYRVAKLLVDGSDVSADQVVKGVFTLTDVRVDRSVRVVFERIPDGPAPEEPPYVNVDVEVKVSVSATTTTNGGALVQPEFLTVPRGAQNLPFYVYPEEGYVLESVSVNGSPVEFHAVEAAAPRAFSNRAALFSASAPGAAGAYWFVVAEAPEDLMIDVKLRKLGEGETGPAPVQMHRVEASASAGGTITPGGSSYVHDGGQAVFGVVPDAGFRLASLTVVQDGVEREAKDEAADGLLTVSNVRGDVTVRAEFESEGTGPVDPEYVTVHAATDGNGTVSPSGDTRVKLGGSQTFTFVPKEGYTLDKVFVDDVETPVEGFSLVLDDLAADTRLFATFRLVKGDEPQPVVHDVTVSAGAGGTVFPSGVLPVEEGSSLSLYLDPDQGFEVASVKVNGIDAPKDAWAGGVFVVENVDGPVRVEVAFSPVAPPQPGKVRITPQVGEHGTISPSSAFDVDKGANVPFTFVPDAGYVVDQVTVNDRPVEFSGTSYTLFNVTEDTVVRVTFKEDGGVPPVKTHVIKATAGLHGSIVPAGEQRVVEGDSKRFEFHPDEGYVVDQVVVDGAAVENPGASYTFENVTAGHSINVTFRAEGTEPTPPPDVKPTYFTITASVVGGHGRISPEGAVQVEQGKARTFQFLPDAGYAVSSLSIDGEKQDFNGTGYRFVDVQADHALEVTFAPVAAPAPSDPADLVDRTVNQAIGFVKTGDANGPLAVTAVVLAAAAAVVAASSRRKAAQQASTRDRAGWEGRR